jgi:hypothetical protein
MAGSIFDEPPTRDELERAKPARQAPASIFDEAPTPDEMAYAKSQGRTRLTPEQAADLARRQGFDESSRGVFPAFARGVGRFGAMIPAMIPEMAHGLSAITYYGIGNAVNALDPSVPAPVWDKMPKIKDTLGQIPGVREFTAENWYKNVVGPDALNIYPQRRPDETTAEMWAGSAGEQLPAALASRRIMQNAVTARTGPVPSAGRPYQSVAQAQQMQRNVNRLTAAEYGGAVVGGEIGAGIDRAQGGSGNEGRAYGSMAGGLAPMAAGAAGTTARYALRGGERGRQDVADAVAASDELANLAGQNYQPTRTQRVLDALGGGSGRPVNLTAGQAAPKRGLVRMIERVASYFPGGYPVLANKIASQLEQAGNAVTTIANRAVERFNLQADIENAQRLPRQNYQMNTTGRGPVSALDETVPRVEGVTDEAAGQALDRGLRERVAMNDNLRRLAEAEFQQRMPADTPISMDGTIRALEDLEVRMPAAPSVSQGTLRSPVIGNLREELLQDATSAANGSVTIPFQVLRRVRERVGQFLQGDNNALGPARMPEADARRLYAALTEDMARAAQAAGPETWLSWQTTQAVTRSGVEVAGDVSRVLRPETWETLFTSVQSGQGSRVRDIMDALPARDRDLVVANVFRRFGAATPGMQDAFGTAWSFDRWLTNINAARQRGSLEALTGSGAKEIADSVNALNKIAERVRARSQFMPNPSGTGRVALTGGTVLAAAAAGLTNPLMAAGVLATGFVAPNLISRLMVNPRFIRWLAKLDETPPRALAGHVLRLGSLATNPETAEAVAQYASKLMDEFSKGDVLDRAAMVDPTPISETLRQARGYAVGGKELTAQNLLGSGAAIAAATLGLGRAPGVKSVAQDAAQSVVERQVGQQAESGFLGSQRKGIPFSIAPAGASTGSTQALSDFTQAGQPSTKSLRESFSAAVTRFRQMSPDAQRQTLQSVDKVLGKVLGVRKDGSLVPLLNKNKKLEKTGSLPDGRGVELTGLSLSPAYKEGNFNLCPNSAPCKDLCLGKKSGHYYATSGGRDLSVFKGARLFSLKRTMAMMRYPDAFSIRLMREIEQARAQAIANGNHLGVRLNTLSDVDPKVHKDIIEAFPDVTFYDYTKNNTDPIAPNHHYTYSSTGWSVPEGFDPRMPQGVHNEHSNWRAMRERLDRGDNVAIAFTTNGAKFPERVVDIETGKSYRVVSGETYDFRPLDIQPAGSDGVIVGLNNREATLKKDFRATQETKGFFVHYDPARDQGEVRVPVQPKSRKTGYTADELAAMRGQGRGR